MYLPIVLINPDIPALMITAIWSSSAQKGYRRIPKTKIAGINYTLQLIFHNYIHTPD